MSSAPAVLSQDAFVVRSRPNHWFDSSLSLPSACISSMISETRATNDSVSCDALASIAAADRVQIQMNPTGGTNLRCRIELAAAFLSHVLIHAYEAAVANELNLAVRRAQEIYGQDGA